MSARFVSSDGVTVVDVIRLSATHGTGLLGLKDRAEALGGHLDLRSPSGAGTTLEITLPLRDLTKPEPPVGAAGESSATRA